MNVNEEFLRTLLASNAIWSACTLLLTGLGGLVLWLWNRKAKAKEAAEQASLCVHCHKCGTWLRGTGKTHVIRAELCEHCAGHMPPPLP